MLKVSTPLRLTSDSLALCVGLVWGNEGCGCGWGWGVGGLGVGGWGWGLRGWGWGWGWTDLDASRKENPQCLSIGSVNSSPLVPHVYASVNWVSISSGYGLSPVRRQAMTWTNAGLLSIGLLGTNFSAIRIGILSFSFKKMHWKLSSAEMAAILSRGRWVNSMRTQYKQFCSCNRMTWLQPATRVNTRVTTQYLQLNTRDGVQPLFPITLNDQACMFRI